MKAVEYFLDGNSCSESVVFRAIELGLCDKELLSVASIDLSKIEEVEWKTLKNDYQEIKSNIYYTKPV